MPGTFRELNGHRFDGTQSPLPRGLVRPPKEVVAQVMHERAKFPPNIYDEAYAKQALDDLTLAWYFEGISVAYRPVSEGVEVLAVGEDEIGELVKGKSQAEQLTFTIKQP